MEATKITTVLTLALIFASVTTIFAKGFEARNSQIGMIPGITYHVNIHLPSFSKDICNTYLVQILDENGRTVAPAQVFIEGVSKYVFHETSTSMGKSRMAVLVPVEYPQHYVCTNDLFTIPDVEMGPFEKGQTYTFDLYPTIATPAAN